MRQPDKRLCAAAELVRQGAVFADIGTDHALLPVFLCETGRISRAVAADINEGPLRAAYAQVTAAGLENKISLRLTDGLTGLENEGLTDIAICGMGGELIADILSRAAFVRKSDIRLILQPMTHAADLRYYLAREGFAITEERRVSAGGKFYFCFAASFTGEPYSITRIEATLGKIVPSDVDDVLLSLIQREKRGQEKKCHGLRVGGMTDPAEEEYLSSLTSLLKELSNDGQGTL